MISFLSSLLVTASISTNAFGAISTSNSTNLKINNNNININNINLQIFNNDVKNKWVNQATWNKFQLQNANINLDYHTFNPQLKTMPWKQVILSNITKGIDYHFKKLEYLIYNKENIFTNFLNQNKIWITILGEKNAFLTLNNNNSDILKPFREPNKEISTFYLRVSNNNSMNWNTNHSFLDVTLNICNFNYSKSQLINNKLIATKNISSVVSNLKNKTGYCTTPYIIHKLFAQSVSNPTLISPQLTTWNSAFKYLDYFSFGINCSDWIYDLGTSYGNYGNVNTFYYAFNSQTISRNTTYIYKTTYPKIISKVNQQIVKATTYDSILLYVSTYIPFGWDEGRIILNFSILNNKLYISIWFWEYSGNYAQFEIKTTNASLNFNYNTNVFDNIYKI